MGRKNNRRGCRPLNQDVIAEILAESGRKNQPSPPTPSVRQSGQLHREGAFAKTEPTEADRAHARAVEVRDRIVRELDEQLEGYPCQRRQ